MIDNAKKTAALFEAMEAALPIPVLPTKELLKLLLQQSNIMLPQNKYIQIERIFYAGDEGGILCSLNKEKQAVVASLTHLLIHPKHPLAKDILNYQKRRVKKLKKINGI
jgi:hypothetical protein